MKAILFGVFLAVVSVSPAASEEATLADYLSWTRIERQAYMERSWLAIESAGVSCAPWATPDEAERLLTAAAADVRWDPALMRTQLSTATKIVWRQLQCTIR